MTHTLIELTEDEFDAIWGPRLRRNHLNPNASWVYCDGPGYLFEPCGAELQFVQQEDPATIWTFVDGDDGDQYFVSGYHFFNRIGYLLSREPVPEGTDIEVHIPFDHEDGDADDEGDA
jgi:hypothetical protein